jgi:serine/threonine protein kinase
VAANSGDEHRYRFGPDHLIDGRYRVIEPLGFGGFAEVYKCREELLDQTYAVKVINLLTAKEDVLREARVAARFRHAHILRVVHIGELEDTGNWYLVMDYQEGSRTLEAVLDAAQENLRRLPLDENTLRIVFEVADALHYAHQMNIIHQDVKPSNIIIDREGHAYLTDFGLALTKRPPGTSMKTLDAVSGMSGTIPYMSPEQFSDIDSAQLGPSTDVYSLGVVAYEMLVGQWPYTSKAPGPLIQQIVSGLRMPPRQLNAEIPERVQDVLLKVLDRDLGKRYSTAVEFATALQKAAEAYITAERLYEAARILVDKRQWRDALASLEQLEDHAPAYKETRLYLERTRKQVQLLELYDQARELVERGEYEACLEKLNILTQIDPNYVVKTVRDPALASLVEQLYEQAVAQSQAEEYQECLETFERIRQYDPQFSDNEGIAGQARRALEQRQYLQSLYSASIRQIQEEDWATAQETLTELHQQAPDYADVEARLTMVRHMTRLSGMYQAAQASYDAGAYARCIDHLHELEQIDKEYKPSQVSDLKTQAIGALYEKADRLLSEGMFEESIQTLDEIEERISHGDPQGIRNRAQQGIADRELRQKLNAQYEKAGIYLNARHYGECLEIMEQIHSQDPTYPDPRDVEQRARESWCGSLYNQALVALTHEEYQEALDLVAQARNIDLQYRDVENVEEQAIRGLRNRARFAFFPMLRSRTRKARSESMPQQASPKPKPNQTPRRLNNRAIYSILAAICVVLLLVGAWSITQIIRNRSAVVAAMATQTETAAAAQTGTVLASATKAKATETAIAEKEATQTAIAKEEATQTAVAREEATQTSVAKTNVAQTATTVAETTQTALDQTHEAQMAAASATAEQAVTATAFHMATASAVATLTRSAIQTATARPTPTPTPTPVPQGTARQSSTVFEGPDDDTAQLGIVRAGDKFSILGRSDEQQYGRWLFVHMDENLEGFVYEPRVEYAIDWTSLPVITVILKIPTTAPIIHPDGSQLIVSSGPLQIVHIWPAGVCDEGGGWTAWFEVKISGGDGRNYKFYWDGEPVTYIVKEAEPDVAVIQRPGNRQTVIGTITVESGGQRESQETDVNKPDC